MAGKRLYSLFHRINGKHIRQTGLAYTKATAIRVFQSALIDGFCNGLGASLRVVKSRYTTEQLQSVAAGQALTVHECCKILDKQLV